MKISYMSNGAFICLTLLTGCAPWTSNNNVRESSNNVRETSNNVKEVEKEVSPVSTPVPPNAIKTIHDNNVIYLQTRSGQSSDQAFDELLKMHQNVIVDFYADWCGPCKNLGKTIERISKDYPNVIFLKVNVDQHQTLANKYNVRSLPTLIFFKNGTKVYTERGDVSSSLKSLIQQHLS